MHTFLLHRVLSNRELRMTHVTLLYVAVFITNDRLPVATCLWFMLKMDAH